MKKHANWSYSPYCPPFFDGGDIYLCRLIPKKDGFSAEWLPCDGCDGYTVFLSRRFGESNELTYETRATSFELDGLDCDCDYCIRIESDGKKSRTRIFHTGTAFGTAVNYLHPDDGMYSFSGKYLCSPSLVRHPCGCLLASMDVFAADYPQNLTLIFRSDDDGATWHYVSELFPCFWGKMFIYGGDLYMLSCSTEYGDLLIGRSTDCGRTFCEPTILLRGSNGKKGECGIHKNPEPVVEFGGRIWNTLEWGSWGRGYHAPMVMSAPVGSDILSADSWSFSEPVKYDPTWDGVPSGPSTGNIEGSLVIRDGNLYNIMRYDMSKLSRRSGLAVVYRVDTDDPESPLTFERCMEFPANNSKFMIKYDERTGKYYSLATRFISQKTAYDRTLLSLMSSDDLMAWNVVCDVVDRRCDDPRKVGLQYTDFIIEGDTIIFLCRTAMNGAASFHDANYSVFDNLKLDPAEDI